MSKKLVWKPFETFEEMEAETRLAFLRLTPYQRIARFFALLAMRRALGIPPKPVDPNSFVLKKKHGNPSESYEGFLKAMNEAGVQYLVVGGFAVIAYGIDRTTGDMDIWVDSSIENADALKVALLTIDYDPIDVEAAINYFKKEGKLSIYIDEGFAVDLMPKYSSIISFEQAFARKKEVDFAGIPVFFVDLDTLIDMKIRAGREKDLWDVKQLQEQKKDKP